MMYFDDLLTDYLGEFGRYQILVFVLCGLTAIPHAFNNLGIVFTGGVPEHWCSTPQLEHLNLSESVLRNLTTPKATDGKYESCLMYDRNYSGWGEDDVTSWLQQGLNDVYNRTTKCAHGYSYSDEVFGKTIVSEWDVVCDRGIILATTTAVYAAGLLFGVLITGMVADVVGRLPTLVLSYIVMTAFSIATLFSPDIITFTALRFCIGFFTQAIFTAAFVASVEIVGPTFRVHTGVAIEYFWAAGYVLYVLPAYFLRDWRTIQLVCACVGIILIPTLFLIPESPRWLYVIGKKERGDKIVTKMAKWNKKALPNHLDIQSKSQERGSIVDLVRTPRLRIRTLICSFTWCVSSMVYYGLSISSGSVGDVYVSFIMSGAIEIPAYIVTQILLVKWGRRWPIAGSLILAGISLLAIIPVPQDLGWLLITLSTIGKFFISIAFAIIYVLTAEIYATSNRQVAVSTGSMFARLGAIVAPYVAYSSVLGEWVPLVIFGACSLTAGILSLQFPETKGKLLPETVEEAEKFGIRKKDTSKSGRTAKVGSDNLAFKSSEGNGLNQFADASNSKL